MSIEFIDIGTLGKNENGWWRCVKTASKLRTTWLKNCICAGSLNELLCILFIYQVIRRLSHLSSLKDLKIFKIFSILLHREKKVFRKFATLPITKRTNLFSDISKRNSISKPNRGNKTVSKNTFCTNKW